MKSPQEVLTAELVRLASEGRRPPCGTWTGAGGWLSDDEDERAHAAGLCRPCPLLAECGAAADERRERFGVWGGTDRTVTTPSRAKTTPAQGRRENRRKA